MPFNEVWYSEDGLTNLEGLCSVAKSLETGAVIEIGCWEGRSAVTIANALPDDILLTVDTWEGNGPEDSDHPTVQALKQRDVYSDFKSNMNEMTNGNYAVYKMDCHEFEKTWNDPIKFVHIDACHDYENVIQTIEALRPHMVEGGIMCGDDFANAHIRRKDLDGGVERAVRESFKKFYHSGNLWYAQRGDK